MVYRNIKTLSLGTVMILFPFIVFSQVSIERQVYASVGLYSEIQGDMNISSTIGETMINTAFPGTFDVTQGFQQPDAMLLPALSVATDVSLLQCPDMTNGFIEVIPSGCLDPYSVSLTRAGDSLPFATKDNVSGVGYTFHDLDTGIYIVTVRGATLCSYFSAEVITTEYDNCDVEIYNGITPNGDGMNDRWIIANIESNQPNEVRIYSRWGTMVWNASNYDNRTVYWEGQSNGQSNLPDGTYFYTVEIPSNSAASKSGWIQLTR